MELHLLSSLTFVISAGIARWFWRVRPRRGVEPGFHYVYVNQDGSVRELSPRECAYLSTVFHGADGGRPYIKSYYESKNRWGSRSGYILRRDVPRRLVIRGVDPDYDARYDAHGCGAPSTLMPAGYIAEQRGDGRTVYTPDPALSGRNRLALSRESYLANEREREALAKIER